MVAGDLRTCTRSRDAQTHIDRTAGLGAQRGVALLIASLANVWTVREQLEQRGRAPRAPDVRMQGQGLGWMKDDPSVRRPGGVPARLIGHAQRGIAIGMEATRIRTYAREYAPLTDGELFEGECSARCEIRIRNERDAAAGIVALEQAAEPDRAAQRVAARMMGEQVERRRLEQQIKSFGFSIRRV